MANLIGPDFIALQVRDLPTSLRFYSERLGLTPAERSPPDAVVFNTKPIPFAIRRPLIDLSAANRLGWGVSLWIACDDVDALYDALMDADVPVLAPVMGGPFGRFFNINDPDGYCITIHESQQPE